MLTKLIIAATALALAAPCLAGTQTRTSRFEYDAQGQLIREIIEPDNSALCLVTTYIPDSHGNRTSTTTRNCNGTTSSGVVEAAAPTGDPVFTPRTSGAIYAAGSDVFGAWIEGQFPTTITNALSHTETRTFDPRFGGFVTLTGPNILTTTWRYDGFGRKISETRADTTVTSLFYERCVDLPAGTCPPTIPVQTPYKGEYRVRATSTGAPTTSTYYDTLNREVRTETQGFDGTLVRKDTQYDSTGRVAQVSRPYYVGAAPAVTIFSYDILGRVKQADEPSGARTVTAYNNVVTATTWTTTVTVSNGASGGAGLPGGVTQSKSTTKNSQGQVVQINDTQNNLLTYTYDEFGNLKTTKDAAPAAAGNVTTLTYDLRGRKKQTIDPDMGTWTYDYNAASDLIRQTDAKLQVTTMVPDPLGRITSRTEPDLVSTWTYDTCTKGKGKLCQATANNGYSRTQSYDGFGRPATLSVTIDTAYNVTTTYDSASRVDTVTYPATNLPAFALQNVYNIYGHLLQIQRVDAGGSTVFWRANAKTASGLVTSELLGNTLTQTRSFDPVDRLSSVVAGAVHNLSYTYDPLGNATQRVDSVDSVTDNFGYDTLNRLTIDSGPNLVTRSFNYDALGDMTYKSDIGTYTYPTAGSARPHAPSSIAGTVNGLTNPLFSYDANGNLTQVNAAGGNPCPTPQAAGERCITYMSFNMPLSINGKDASGSSATYTYTYSPEHERVRLVTARPTGTQTTIYLHPGGGNNLLYEKEIKPDGSLEHKHYVNAGAQLVGVYVMKSAYASGDGPQMRYYHLDGIGSIMAISNEAGAPIERLAYEPFGKRRFPNGTIDPNGSIIGITTDRGFTEHEHLDELQLIHMNGRVYDPVLARFMTPDPGVPYPYNLQSFNRYSYALNNPLRIIDPSGFEEEDESGGGGGDFGGGGTNDFSNLLNQFTNWITNLFNPSTGGNSNVGLSSSDASWANGTPSSVIPPVPGTQGNGLGQGLVMGLGRSMFGNTVGSINDAGTGADQQDVGQILLGAAAQFGRVVGATMDILRDPMALGLGSKYENTFSVDTPSQRVGAAGIELTLGVGLGLRGIAAREAVATERGVTVLGHYPGYVNTAQSIGARYLDVPPAVWARMTPTEQWAANTRFLDRLMARGDNVLLSTPALQAAPNSFFARELEYLTSRGYTVSSDGRWLLPLGR